MRRKTTATVTREVTTTEYLCDVCGKELEHSNRADHFRMDDADVEALIGEVFPEGDFRTRYRLDICGPCFVEKLIPVVEAGLGVKFVKEDAEG